MWDWGATARLDAAVCESTKLALDTLKIRRSAVQGQVYRLRSRLGFCSWPQGVVDGWAQCLQLGCRVFAPDSSTPAGYTCEDLPS